MDVAFDNNEDSVANLTMYQQYSNYSLLKQLQLLNNQNHLEPSQIQIQTQTQTKIQIQTLTLTLTKIQIQTLTQTQTQTQPQAQSQTQTQTKDVYRNLKCILKC